MGPLREGGAMKKARDAQRFEHVPAEDAEMVRGVVMQAMRDLKKLRAPQLIGDFADMLVRTLAYRTRIVKVPAATPAGAAKQLEALAEAVEKLCVVSDSLNKLAFEEINARKGESGAVWRNEGSICSFLRPGELRRFFDEHYPELVTVTRQAAKSVRQSSKAGKTTGRRGNDYELALAVDLASIYESLTGKLPGKGKNGTAFQAFVDQIFSGTDIAADSTHYASMAADLYRRHKSGENVRELGFHISRL
jgi:hypothetical protein